MMHGDASLWESFPRVLERRAGTRRYVGAFRAPFQDLRLTPPQEHALRACSILAIPPPPPGQDALPGGVPEDLSLRSPQDCGGTTYITGCHICQMFKKGKNFQRPYQKRMNINTSAMTRISMDIEQMPVNRGYSHILVLLCEVSNYMVALPLSSTRTQSILEGFQRGYLAYFGLSIT